MISIGFRVVTWQAGRQAASSRTTPNSLVHWLVLSSGLLFGLLSDADGRTCRVFPPLISHLFLYWFFASEVLVQCSGRLMGYCLHC